MKDIIININSTTHKVDFPDEFLGIGLENLQGNLIFQFDNNFIGGQARLEAVINDISGAIYNLQSYGNGYIVPIKSSLLTGSNVLMQLVIDETSLTQYTLTTDTTINPNKTYYIKQDNSYIVVENPVVADIGTYYEAETPVFKTDIFLLKVRESINAEATIPDEYPTWINTLNTLIAQINSKLILVDEALTEMDNLNIDVSNKVNGEVTITFTDKAGNTKVVKINDGRGIVSIIKTATVGNVDTYTITYTDETTSTFNVTNGIDGTDGVGIESIYLTGTSGLTDTYTILYTNGETTTFNVKNGKGITKIEKISTNLLVDTYKITFNDGTTQNYEVTNGKGIVSIEKTSTSGLTDIYTITYNDNTTSTFNVSNGKGIVSIEKTSTVGYVDTYTITYNDGTTSTYNVTNGEVSQAQLDEVQAEVDYYKTTLNALPKITGTGTELTLNNTANAPMSMVLNPNTSQGDNPSPDYPQQVHVVTGDNEVVVGNKNLFNPNIEPDYKQSGMSYTPTNTGIKIKSTSTYGGITFRIGSFEYFKGKTLTIKMLSSNLDKISSASAFVLYNKNNFAGSNEVIGSALGNDGEVTVTIPNSSLKDTIGFRFYLSNATANQEYEINNIQLEQNSTATTYEPHEEQTAQLNLGDLEYCEIPNSDYKDDFVNPSKNIFDILGGERGGIDSSGVEVSNNNSWRPLDYIEAEPNTYYTLSIRNYSSSYTLRLYEYNSNKEFISPRSVVDDGSVTVKTTANTKYLRYVIYIPALVLTQGDINSIMPQLEKSSIATEYVPYNPNGKWYLKKNIRHLSLAIADMNNTDNYPGWQNMIQFKDDYPGVNNTFDAIGISAISNIVNSSIGFLGNTRASGPNGIIILNKSYFNLTQTDWQTNYPNLIVQLYYNLQSPEYTLLNNTLQTELNNIQRLLGYKDQTNISQVNDDLPFKLDVSCIKDLTNL